MRWYTFGVTPSSVPKAVLRWRRLQPTWFATPCTVAVPVSSGTLTVEDSSAVGAAMVADGGTVIIPIEDRPYGNREGRVRDPFGHLWVVSQDLAVE